MPEQPSPHSSAAAERATSVRWQMVLMLMVFTGLNHFHRQSLTVVADEIKRDCGFTNIGMGWIYTSFLAGYVVFMVAGGWFADRRGGWLTLVLSGFGTAGLVAATGYCGYLGSTISAYIAFLVVRCLMGVLTTPLFPAAGRVVNAWIPFGSRAWGNGLVLGATTIGVSSAPLLFGRLADRLGWKAACGVMGLITAVMTLLWFVRGRNRPDEHPATNEAERALVEVPAIIPGAVNLSSGGLDAFWKLLANPSLLFLTLNYAAVGYYEYTLFYWMKYYFKDVRGFSEETSRNFTSIVTAAMIVAMPLGGILSDKLVRAWGYRAGRAAVPIFGMLSSAILLFVATRATTPVMMVSLFFLAHAAIGLCEAPTWVAGLELGGRHCGTAAAIVNTGGNLGGLLAPVITAYVATAYGWNAGFLVASAVCLVGAVQWFGVRLIQPLSVN